MIADDSYPALDAALRSLWGTPSLPAAYVAFLEQARAYTETAVRAPGPFLAVDLPLAIGEALEIPAPQRTLLAAGCLLVWLGADLFDNVLDEELEARWRAFGPGRVALGSVTILTVLPHRLWAQLAALGVPVERCQALSAALAEALWVMSVGQFRDLGAREEVDTPKSYLTLVAEKSGAEFAFFAEAAALLAGRPAEEVARWRAFGETLAMAGQLLSDVADIFGDPSGNDLRNGKRTLPVLFALQTLQEDNLEQFRATLVRAQQGDLQAERWLCTTMREAGALSYALLRAEVLRQQARRHLHILLPDPAHRAPVEALTNALAFFTLSSKGDPDAR